MFGFFERRKATRFAVDIPVDVDASETALSLHTHIREVSVDGLQLVTEKPIELGALVKLAFELPRTPQRPRPMSIVVQGHVIHSKRRDERFFEVGVNIEVIDPAAQEAYAIYLASLGAR